MISESGISFFRKKHIEYGTLTCDNQNYNVVLYPASDNSYDVYAEEKAGGFFRPIKDGGLPDHAGTVIKTNGNWISKPMEGVNQRKTYDDIIYAIKDCILNKTD